LLVGVHTAIAIALTTLGSWLVLAGRRPSAFPFSLLGTRFVVSALERLAIPYFVTGSVVTIFYGEPRFTNDIDVVVDLTPETAGTFCRQFPENDFDVSLEAALEAIRHHSMFNIIQPRTGLKVDVIARRPPSSTDLASFVPDGYELAMIGMRRSPPRKMRSSRSWSSIGRAARTSTSVTSRAS